MVSPITRDGSIPAAGIEGKNGVSVSDFPFNQGVAVPAPVSHLCRSMESFWGKLFTFLFGVAATFIGFLFNEAWQKKKEEKKRLQKLMGLLRALERELDFYRVKLAELATALAGPLKARVRKTEGFVIPSYSFYPEFLDKAKASLIDYYETAELVPLISECHFELGHVRGKLESLSEQICSLRNDPRDFGESILANAASLRSLATHNLQLFMTSRDRVAAKLNEIRGKVEVLYSESVFGWALRD